MAKPAPLASSHRYIVEKKYGDPRYAKKLSDAKGIVHDDLDKLMTTWRSLSVDDAMEATVKVRDQVDRIPVDGGIVTGVVDPYSGQKYWAKIILRNPV